MSLEEMESTWSAQSAPKPTTDPRTWIDKSHRAFRTHAVLLLVAILGNGLSLGLQIHRLIVLPERTVANSTWELVIPGLTFLICIGGVVLFRRFMRKYRSLMHDTRRCLELILKEKRREVSALTWWIPAACRRRSTSSSPPGFPRTGFSMAVCLLHRRRCWGTSRFRPPPRTTFSPRPPCPSR